MFIQKSQPIALLNIGIDLLSPMHQPVVSHLLLAARLMMLRNWKSVLAHDLSDVERIVDHNYFFERILAMNAMKYKAFSKSWSIWMSRREPSSGTSTH